MEYLKSAISSIKQNKGRTFLTMLGIIIGIASVITILSIGNGMKSYVNTSLDEMSSGGVTINLDPKKTDRYLNIDDLEKIRDVVPEMLGITNSISANGEAVTDKQQLEVGITGGLPDIARENTKGMFDGRFFRQDDVESGAAVCVISQEDAILLFNTDEVVDKSFQLNIGNKSSECSIVGVTRSDEEDIKNAREAVRKKEQAYNWCTIQVPYTLLTGRFGLSGEKITSFKIYTSPGIADETALKVKSVTENLIDVRGEGAVQIQSFASIAGAYNNILNIVTLVVALIAAISLLVGGIGVMNIMTVTVTERTREIGIRKSLGAKTSYILIQFLTESAVITLIGGMIGILMGYLFTRIVQLFMSFPPVISPMDVLMVVTISIADGLFFGIYPARKAAKMDPIEALRQE
ncbi:ABC transporter permease [Butyrivibrio sp. WCE2006]|uniref:ABC transporter permease n=1 Tax=Butyrivibrio sp. WCE2006 TaxID=1410611 RepID=UPI0006793C04|nr:ABC transporter permease [Butyrivibrio sp. WCE2006]